MSETRAAPRIEAVAKVTGAARFEGDVPALGALHAALVCAPHPSARVRSIDAGRALGIPGVVRVLSHESMPRIHASGFLALLQEPVVHFAGQPVAVVLAETPRAARRGAAAVNLSYEILPAVTAMDQAHGDAYAPRAAGRIIATDSRRGEPEAALAAAELVVDHRYTTATNNHHPLEPQVLLAAWRDETLLVHTTSQAVFAHRKAIADCFGLAAEAVRVVSTYLGGGFGAKGGAWFPCLVLGILAAKAAGRPVRLELTRAQMFTLTGRRQQTVQHLRLGATRDGTLTAILHDTLAQTSAYGEYADPVATPSRVLHACANVATTHRLVRLNAPQPNPMRAPGEGPGSFALESALDELAHELGLDPVELRLRNVAEFDQHLDLPWSSNGLRECYRVGAEAFGWKDRPKAPRSVPLGRRLLGQGMAAACYPVYRIASEAVVAIAAGGGVTVRCGTQDMGSGTYTALAQIAAVELGVPLASVGVELGDTLLPEGPYSGGSMATASFAPAVAEAASTLRRRLTGLAVGDSGSPLHGLPADRIAIVEGVIRDRSGNASERLADLLSRAAPSGLEAFARAAPAAAPAHSSYGYGAVFAEVGVDPDLGEVRVTRLTAAYAAGRILNPLLARSQYAGGLIGGIGMALHEATGWDARLGRVVGESLADYLIPVHADMPRFDIHMLDEDDPHLAGGIKGIGMLGTVGTAAAIANAVFHATGIRIRDLPIRLEHVLPPG